MEKRRLAAIMFTDIVGYTRLMGVDEDKAFKVLDNNRKLHKDLLIQYDGQKLKEIGDGMLCSFDSASKAVKCAIELIRKSSEHKELKLRIGIHLGEVVFSGNDVFGDGVNIASRIEAMAISDSVLISGKVYDEIKNKPNIKVKFIGTYNLKNDTKPREIYAIANTQLEVPIGKDLLNITEDRPDLQKIPISSTHEQKSQGVKKRFKLSSPRVGLTILFSLMSLAFGSFLFISFNNSRNVRRAELEILPEVERLTDSISSAAGLFGFRKNTFKAFEFANHAAEYIEGNKRLEVLFDEISNHKSIHTDPEGAAVFIKSYHDQQSDWKYIGETPLIDIRFPLGLVRIKFEKAGFDDIEDIIRNMKRATSDFHFTLPKEGNVPKGMAYCQSSKHIIGDDTVLLEPFFMDKFEVQNKDFREFIKAGGYLNEKYWKYTFVDGNDTLSWDDAMRRFKDKTNQYGPSTWVAGDYPKSKENHPVTGVSWYEASAFAEYLGKSLPTTYHFKETAQINTASDIIPYSNFSNNGTREVGTNGA